MLKINSIVNDGLIFCLLLLSGSVLHVGFFTPTYVFTLTFVLIFLLYKGSFNKKELFLFLFTFLLSIVFFILNFLFSKSTDFKDYAIVLMQVLLSLLIILAFKLTNADLKYHIYRVLKLILIVSLIGFFLSPFNLGKPVDFSGYIANTIFYLFYYFAEINIGPLLLYRNQGIFWEPGLLAIYANIFLFLSIHFFKSKKNIALAFICIISSFSTTGIFMMIVQIAFLSKGRKFTLLQKTATIATLIPIIVLGVYSFLGKKTESEERELSSYGMRTFDLYSGSMVAINHPIFGVGLNKTSFIIERDKFLPPEIELIYEKIGERGNSNSLLALFYSLGSICAFLWLFMLYRQNVFINQRGMFFFIIVFGFLSEPLVFTPFFMAFMFMGLQRTLNIKYE